MCLGDLTSKHFDHSPIPYRDVGLSVEKRVRLPQVLGRSKVIELDQSIASFCCQAVLGGSSRTALC